MNIQPVSIDFTVTVDFEKKGGLYIARAEKLGMITTGRTRAEAQRRISEGLELLSSFFRERPDGRKEAIRYLESRAIEFQIRIEGDEEPEPAEIPMSFGVPA